MISRCFSAAIATLSILAVGVQVPDAVADPFPSRPVTIVVPFPAGGALDLIARILADRMKSTLGQPVVVENISGAGGSVGIARVARAAPDGHTLVIGDWTSHVASGAIYPARYDLLKDFAPVSLLTTSPLLIVGKNALPADDLRGLIAWLKANPDNASAATVGLGSNPHICGISFQTRTGTRFQFVPYRGGAAAMQDLIGGHVDFMCSDGTNVVEHVRSGRLKGFAVLSKSRWIATPDVPTSAEAGLPGFHVVQWRGLWGPKGTPKDAIAKLDAAVTEALADAGLRQRAAEIGQEIVPHDQQTPAALAAHHKAEIEKWWPIIKTANIKPE